MIQPISGPISSAARSSTAAGVKASPEVQWIEDETQNRAQKPVMDEYVPEEPQEPSGLYRMGRDENGQPKVYFDDPERKGSGDRAERCTCSTDRVDREIEVLRKKREELEQQIRSQTDDTKVKALEQKMAQVERELSQKDNDAYRRQHAVFS